MLEGFIFGIAMTLCMGNKFNFTHLVLIALAKLAISLVVLNYYPLGETARVYLFATVGYSILFVYKYFIMPRLK